MRSSPVLRPIARAAVGIVALAGQVVAASETVAPPGPVAEASGDAAGRSLAWPRPEDIPALDAVVHVVDFGAFRIRLDRHGAPNHVAAFLTLASSGAFDGLGFHRIVPGYLVQTGDPSSRDDDPWNDGGTIPPWRIPAEATAETHTRGTVSMAWLGDEPGTAGSQWFVALADLPQLDAHATPIGEVVEGMDVVDAFSQVTTLRNRYPLHPVRVEKVELVPPAADPSGEAPASDGGLP